MAKFSGSSEITNVWITPERDALAFELDNGDGGTFVYAVGKSHAEEVSELLGSDWIALGGGR